MGKPRPLLAPRTPTAAPVTITFDGEAIAADPGDTVSAALLRAGHLATTRSPKYRRPRGPFCLVGECGTCQVRIGGQPNLRACTTLVREGLAVESQNQWGPRGLDPTGLVDAVFRGGFDHHHFMVWPRLANTAMQAIARTMTGFGTLPDADALPPPPLVDEDEPEVLVLGAGPSGRAAARALEGAGARVLCVDRRDRRALEAWHADPLPACLRAETGVFGVYVAEGLVAAASPPLADGPPRLHLLRPRHLVLATGAREGTLPLRNNDLPGVIGARGLRHLLRRCDADLAARCVVVGEGDEAEALARDLGARRFALAEVERIVGDDRVEAIVAGGQKIPCDLVALAPPLAAASELAAQAGARVDFDGDGFPVATEPGGRVLLDPARPLADAPTPWTLWACGDVRGAAGHRDPAADGVALAASILAARAAEARR